MHHFRYYAIGHSYLKHGPFAGWQTNGFWGMAASAPECDYYHRFLDGLKNTFDCRIESIAENYAAFERLCTEDATREKYTSSPEYAHMREVLKTFKPNVITVFVGDGNTLTRDAAALTLFFEVLYELLACCKLPEAVVVCPDMNAEIFRLSKQVADKYGFISVDLSFLHNDNSRNNPYYAFDQYPEYDAYAAKGAVEFRTHPNDKGHAAIADALLKNSESALAQIPEGAFDQEYFFEKFISADKPARLEIKTTPQMEVSYFGFNIRQNGACVSFGSAPGTGASLMADGFCVSRACGHFFAELAVDGVLETDTLTFLFKGTDGEGESVLPIVGGMHRYNIEVPAGCGEILSLQISPNVQDCVVSVEQIGFEA